MMLRLEGVAKRYGGRFVLNDISFRADAGSLTYLAGANGSGKSTLLRIMSGLLRPDSGMVTRNVPRGSIGYMSHETMLYPELTALENLAFWRHAAGKDAPEDLLFSMLERMNLAHCAHEKAGTFSRGMIQRLSLGRLLLADPLLVLLDEPETGLDAVSRELLLRELGRIRHAGAALVWVTHFPGAGLAAEDAEAAMVALLENRRLAFMGPLAGYRAFQDQKTEERKRAGGGR